MKQNRDKNRHEDIVDNDESNINRRCFYTSNCCCCYDLLTGVKFKCIVDMILFFIFLLEFLIAFSIYGGGGYYLGRFKYGLIPAVLFWLALAGIEFATMISYYNKSFIRTIALKVIIIATCLQYILNIILVCASNAANGNKSVVYVALAITTSINVAYDIYFILVFYSYSVSVAPPPQIIVTPIILPINQRVIYPAYDQAQIIALNFAYNHSSNLVVASPIQNETNQAKLAEVEMKREYNQSNLSDIIPSKEDHLDSHENEKESSRKIKKDDD